MARKGVGLLRAADRANVFVTGSVYAPSLRIAMLNHGKYSVRVGERLSACRVGEILVAGAAIVAGDVADGVTRRVLCGNGNTSVTKRAYRYGGLYLGSASRVGEVLSAFRAVPIENIALFGTGRAARLDLNAVMRMLKEAANGTATVGAVCMSLRRRRTLAVGADVEVTVLCRLPFRAVVMALRNGLHIGGSATVIAGSGLGSLRRAGRVAVVNVIREAVSRFRDKLGFYLAAFLTGVRRRAVVGTAGVNGNAFGPLVLTVAAGGQPQQSDKQNEHTKKRENDFSCFLHT